jgi:2-succinyl-5-enolpyruvyl-6-hydroxy-3-cyclohexene-1-carboxylate synthase
VSLVIVVVDNDGGGIFSFLPQREALAGDRFERLFGTPHGTDLVAVAEAHGVPAERVSSRAGLQAAVAGAFTRGGPRVVVVTTGQDGSARPGGGRDVGGRDANVALHRELARAVAQAVERASVGPDG